MSAPINLVPKLQWFDLGTRDHALFARTGRRSSGSSGYRVYDNVYDKNGSFVAVRYPEHLRIGVQFPTIEAACAACEQDHHRRERRR